MTRKLSIDVIKAFAEATVEMCEKMLRVRPTVGKPYVTDPGSRMYGVSGIMGISGTVAGVVVLTLPDETAVKAINAFAGGNYQKIESDVIDGVMELTNIIVGGAKAKLAGQGYEFELGLPKMVVGHTYTSNHGKESRMIVIPFDAPFGQFVLDVSLRPASDHKE